METHKGGYCCWVQRTSVKSRRRGDILFLDRDPAYPHMYRTDNASRMVPNRTFFTRWLP